MELKEEIVLLERKLELLKQIDTLTDKHGAPIYPIYPQYPTYPVYPSYPLCPPRGPFYVSVTS